MPHPLLILLSLLLLFAGCKESEETIIEVAKAEKVVVEIEQVEPEEEPPLKLPDELIVPEIDPNTIDPNFLILREPLAKVDSPDHSRFIIRPDMSKDYKMIIIAGDPNIDPGIFGGKRFDKGRRRYKGK